MNASRIVITGSSGLIGTALVQSLRADDIPVTLLVRRPPATTGELQWAPGEQELNPEVLAGAAAIVNLNGSSIGDLPWTAQRRKVLYESRMGPTRTLAKALRALGDDAPHLVSASAVGFYGNRPGEILTEESTAGTTFLARLSAVWEHEATASGSAARVALLRTAPLLHPQAVLKPLVLLTQIDLAGPLGDGTQVWPWISLTDEVRAIRHVISKGIIGPVNLTGPQTATARDIGSELARQMHRPYLLPMPGWALRILLGADPADSLLLTDADAPPTVLSDSGFAFVHPTYQAAISAALAD